MASKGADGKGTEEASKPKPRADPMKGCPMAKKADEPVDAADTFVPAIQPTNTMPEEAPGTPIPSSGRGNSDDGQHWVNPSAGQLYRALKRKNKPIQEGDAEDVADVHAMVTDMSWECVMEYERLHPECPNPTLGRFYGMYGILSWKSKWLKWRTGIEPFDRHDWVVDRCGKEVRYIIDYYSVEVPTPHGDPEIVYSIDARPAITFGGVVDRVRLAWKKWQAGEDPW